MAKFIVHTVVHQDQKPVFFEPGDAVPAWAESLVGDHVIDQPAGDSRDDAKDTDTQIPADDASDSGLDFSAKATSKSAAKTARKK